jgi:hypothetical protein
MKQFADNLKTQIAAQPAAAAAPGVAPAPGAPAAPAPATSAPAAAPPAAKPISGFSLMASVIWDAIKRLFGSRPA